MERWIIDTYLPSYLIKFTYSEKATKIKVKISHFFLLYTVFFWCAIYSNFFGLHLLNVFVFIFFWTILMEVIWIFLSLAIYKLSYSDSMNIANDRSKCHFPKGMVFCYPNCSDLLWEKIVLVMENNFSNLRLKAENLQKFWDH